MNEGIHGGNGHRKGVTIMREDQRDEYTEAMAAAINKAKLAAALQSVGSLLGVAARIFGVPWLAVYAWNGLTTLPDWHYLPAVAGFFVLSIVLNLARGPRE